MLPQASGIREQTTDLQFIKKYFFVCPLDGCYDKIAIQMRGEGDGGGGWGRGMGEGNKGGGWVVSICKIGTFLVILRTFCLSVYCMGIVLKWPSGGGRGKGAVVYICMSIRADHFLG